MRKQLKWGVVISLFFFTSIELKAQSSLKPMVKQISLIQIYIGYLEKGYDIARKGLNTIGDIKNGHWRLDIDFFNSLKNVNPAIKNYAKVAPIIQDQVAIVKECSKLKKQSFNNDEMEYINTVVTRLLSECETLVDELGLVLKGGQLQMSDDERIGNIDGIYDEVREQYQFIKSFSAEAKLLLRNKAKEKKDIRVSEKLRGL